MNYNQSASPQIFDDLSSVFVKKVGDFLKQGSGSLVKSGLKIPRRYFRRKVENNYGNSNPELEKRMEKDLETFLKEHPDVKKEDIPADLLTASGSGLDPHISPKAAEVQIETVAKNSGL